MSEKRKDNWAAGKLYEPYVGRWSRLVSKDFLQWLGLPAQLDWLDVGCGTGALTETILQDMQQRSVTGIDIPTTFRDFDDYWNPFLGGQGPAPGYAMSLDEERRGALRDRIRATLPTPMTARFH